MHKITGVAALLGLACVAGTAFGQEVYTCEIDGHKVFSQEPCGGKVETVKNVGERSVRVSMDMPQSDIDYLCHIAMRAWDSAGDKNSRVNNGTTTTNFQYSWNANGGYSYSSSSHYTPGHSRRDIRDFILSHVSNLEELSNQDTQLYHLVGNIADNYSVNNSSSNTTAIEYEANRNELSNQCREQFGETLNHMAVSRETPAPKPTTPPPAPHFNSSTLGTHFPTGQ